MVRDTLTAVEAGRVLVVPGPAMKVGMLIVHLTPRSVLRLAARLSR